MKKQKVKLVMIEWLDSARPIAEWQYLSDYTAMKPVSCVSVGFLVHDGDDIKALAPNMGDIYENMQVSGVIHIPTCSVLTIKELVEKE